MKWSILLALACAVAPCPAQERHHSITGTVVEIPGFESRILGAKRDIHVWMPPGYALSSGKFDVLYMLDGQNCFDGFTSFIPNQEWQADETATALVQGGLVKPLVIVAIDNGGMKRGDEYLPTRATFHGVQMGGEADKYLRFIADEVKPMVEGRFRTYSEPDHNGICGSSMGGVFALYAALSRPDVFGKACVVFPSLWWDDKVMLARVRSLPRKLKVKLWTDIGTDEGDSAVPDSRELWTLLKQKGWKPGEDATFFEDVGAKHSEVAWSKRFGMMLMFLFPAHRP